MLCLGEAQIRSVLTPFMAPLPVLSHPYLPPPLLKKAFAAGSLRVSHYLADGSQTTFACIFLNVVMSLMYLSRKSHAEQI